MPRQGSPVYQEASEVERRLGELQSQIDRLSLSLHLWREKQEELQPIEQRLSRLAEQCAQIVERWSVTGGRHAEAVGELERRLASWNVAEARVAQDAAARIQDLQKTIEHEWIALRQLHEEPIRQLREQASSLSQVSVAAANSVVTGFERTEARLSGLETDLHRRLTELSNQVQSMAAEVRSGNGHPAALPAQTPSWPLDNVVRLHNQLRRAGDGPVDAAAATPEARPQLALPEAPAEILARMQSLERDLAEGQTRAEEAVGRAARTSRLWLGAVLVLVAAIAALAWLAVSRLQEQVGAAEARVSAAETAAQAAARAADEQIAAAREEASREIADARAAAARAQTISDVLAAPDLVRYTLVSGETGSPQRAQALWSRSRGLIFSASRLSPPPPDSTYQLWLLTNAEAVSAGVFVPDAAGRFTLATDTPPAVPRLVAGISVTIEPASGRAQPGGTTVLASAE